MFILVTYDVNTESDEGKKRLKQVAKICERHGQRVQNSVFECLLEDAQYIIFKNELNKVIDEKVDNLRFYRLGKNYKCQIESLGVKNKWAQDDVLIL